MQGFRLGLRRLGRTGVALCLAVATLFALVGAVAPAQVAWAATAVAPGASGVFGGVAWSESTAGVLTLSAATVPDTTNKCAVWPTAALTAATTFAQAACQPGQIPSNGFSVTGPNGVSKGSSSTNFYPWAGNTTVTSVVIAAPTAPATSTLAAVGNVDDLFYGMSNVTAITGADNVDTSKMTSAESLVAGDKALKSFPDVSGWAVSNLRDTDHMFSLDPYNCVQGGIAPPQVGKWQTTNLQTTSFMFAGDCALTNSPDISHWDISSLVNAQFMFANMTANSVGISRLDFSSWTTDKVNANAVPGPSNGYQGVFASMLSNTTSLSDVVLPAKSALMTSTYGNSGLSTLSSPAATGWVNTSNPASTDLNAVTSLATSYTTYGAGEYIVKAVGVNGTGTVLYNYNSGQIYSQDHVIYSSLALPYSGAVGATSGQPMNPLVPALSGYILCGWNSTPKPAADSCADQDPEYPTQTNGSGGSAFTLTSDKPAATFYALWAVNASAVLPSIKFAGAVTSDSTNPGTYTFPIFIGNTIDVSVSKNPGPSSVTASMLGTYLSDSSARGGGVAAVQIAVTDPAGKPVKLNSDGKTFTPTVSAYPYAPYTVTYTYPYASPTNPDATLTATVHIQVKDYTGILASPRVVVKVADIDDHDPFADIASTFKADHTLVCGNVPKIACDDSSHTPVQVNGSPIHAWIVDDSSDSHPVIWDSVKNAGTLPSLQAGGVYSELFSVKDYSGNDVTTQYDTSDSSQSGPVAATLLKVSDSALSLDAKNQYTYKGIPWSPLDDFVAATDIKGYALVSPNKDKDNNTLPPTVTYANGQASFALANSNGSATVTVSAYEGWDLSEDYSKGDVSCADRTGDTPVSLTAGYLLGPGPYCVSYTLNSTVNGTTSTLTTVIGLFVDMSPQGHTYPKGSDNAQPITANALYSPNDNFVLAYDIQGTIEQIADLVNGAPIKETIVKCAASDLAADGSVPKTGCTGTRVYDDTVRSATDSTLKTFSFDSLAGGGPGTYSVLYTITDGSIDNTTGRYVYNVSSEAVRLDVVAPYQATFNANAGDDTVTGSMASLIVPIDNGSDNVGHINPLPDSGFTRDGYVFVGWDVCPGSDLTTDCNNGLLAAGQSSPDITSDVTLFAVWQQAIVQSADAVVSPRKGDLVWGLLVAVGLFAIGLCLDLARRQRL